mmetsp:Transcript_29954/g.84494  ORF Transcript_29954/g.84494 Transcript_29954/m.84494 type:complete len:218 (-) Transcript_29954:128-781(-)
MASGLGSRSMVGSGVWRQSMRWSSFACKARCLSATGIFSSPAAATGTGSSSALSLCSGSCGVSVLSVASTGASSSLVPIAASVVAASATTGTSTGTSSAGVVATSSELLSSLATANTEGTATSSTFLSFLRPSAVSGLVLGAGKSPVMACSPALRIASSIAVIDSKTFSRDSATWESSSCSSFTDPAAAAAAALHSVASISLDAAAATARRDATSIM